MENVVNDVIDVSIILLSEELREIVCEKTKRRKCRKWITRRESLGASKCLFRELACEDPIEYRKRMRMSIEKFDQLLLLVENDISKTDTVMKSATPARLKLEVTLQYLATGNSFTSLALLFRIPPCTISKFLPETLQAIINALDSFLKVPASREEWKRLQEAFKAKWNFPNCCGAIDGKHCQIKRPDNSCSEFYNYKGTYSIILFALVDADYRFIFIDVGTNGRVNDSAVFRNSTLNSAMENNSLDWPENSIIVGDDAFPLKTNLLKPYAKVNLTLKQKIFNYRLSRARRVSENAFGILAQRFRVFGRPMEVKVTTADLVVKSACYLHNWLRMTSSNCYINMGSVDYEDLDTGILHKGHWRTEQNLGLDPVRNIASNNYSKSAADLREKYADYFSEAGTVPWQLKAIGAD